MDTLDEHILHATEEEWACHQRKAAERCKAFELAHWIPREKLEAMSIEEYLVTRYYDVADKKGLHHIRNLVASEMNSAKSKAGSSFENVLMRIAHGAGVRIVGQVHIDENGNVCPRKSRHRIDGYISQEATAPSVRNCIVLSNKTTLRERWNQDVWCIPLCKKLIILTRETPNSSTLESIRHHGAIVVYPQAPTTEASWSYGEFFRRMKLFQEGVADSLG
jgi:hypothetical protein